ncbi:MAG TPA: hypothetical protein VK468_01400 [Pyrinomonadaceae bacterium]|nr:hypothetical protein [Pyrinomonadaceae bacterium]
MVIEKTTNDILAGVDYDGLSSSLWKAPAMVAVFAVSLLVYFLNVYRNHLDRWDDAFITFRFAQHLADGVGLVWNLGGERVEGFTSFLHVLLLAVGFDAGIDPWTWSLIISGSSVVITAVLLIFLLRHQFGSVHPAAAVVIGIYLIDRCTALHTDTGLETQLFVAVLACTYTAAFLFVDSPRWASAIGLAVFIFISCLCRPEAVLYGAAVYFALAVFAASHISDRTFFKNISSKLAVSMAIVTVGGLAYVAWKYAYFGYVLPNPYYVKSNKFAFAGIHEVTDYLSHLLKWLGPIAAAGVLILLFGGKNENGAIANAKTRFVEIVSLAKMPRPRAKLMLTLMPPIIALAFYSTIIHEVGGAYRFSYPTYFYFALAVAAFVSLVIRRTNLSNAGQLGVFGMAVVCFCIILFVQKNWRIDVVPVSSFNQYHYKIANALAATGLGSKATILCDAAGIIPYVSGFNQVDRVGLVDNYLSGRKPITAAEKENYLWSRRTDVYVGYEPPAGIEPDASDDRVMQSQYVSKILLQRQLTLVESRIFVQDPDLLRYRMMELRDDWYFLGEMDWPGWHAWKLKSFIYVRKDSPYAQQLITSLQNIVIHTPAEVDLNDIIEP